MGKRMGRPPTEGEKTSEALLTVRMPQRLKWRLEAVAAAEHVPLARAVRDLLVEALDRRGG